jgi:hypothetical protein
MGTQKMNVDEMYRTLPRKKYRMRLVLNVFEGDRLVDVLTFEGFEEDISAEQARVSFALPLWGEGHDIIRFIGDSEFEWSPCVVSFTADEVA